MIVLPRSPEIGNLFFMRLVRSGQMKTPLLDARFRNTVRRQMTPGAGGEPARRGGARAPLNFWIFLLLGMEPEKPPCAYG